MRTTATTPTSGTESREASTDFAQELCHAADHAASGTATPGPGPRESSKRIVMRPGQVRSVSFPYSHAHEKEKERIRRLNEALRG